MHVRLLGTAAGGASPQWNCNCRICLAVRAGAVRPRTQSCAAVSADGTHWFLLNASPDLRIQIESFPPLLPPLGVTRGTPIQGVLLTNADLDHVLGLLLLREGGRVAIHAAAPVRQTLVEAFTLLPTLESYTTLSWLEPPAELSPLHCADGTDSGLRYAAWPLPGKPPRYAKSGPIPGDCVAYQIMDARTGGRLLYMPEVGVLTPALIARMGACDLLLFDGTFWSEDEMERQGVGHATAARMGHLPVSGSEGSLTVLATLDVRQRVYVHINNTNPILLDDSPERTAVERAGVKVGMDGDAYDL